ncbi:MAG TPA: antibiotic biosynthesis monooxygenase [Roseateles sp.]|nr:antibiotic biosynthesis monooxygenase [Roseateles sp.]
MDVPQKLVVVFRSRLRADADLAALEPLGQRMYELASSMPGFLSYKDFSAADGETLALVEFADADTLRAWREHPEHREVQRRSREEFMSEYQIDVCRPERSYGFKAGG